MFEVVEEMVVWVEVGVVEVEVLVLMLVELVLVTEEVAVLVELVEVTEVVAVLELVVVSVSDPVTGRGGGGDWLLSCCPDGPSPQQDGGPGLISRQRLGTDPQGKLKRHDSIHYTFFGRSAYLLVCLCHLFFHS
ncbi:unnamed protein product [Arctogadus glacialis]